MATTFISRHAGAKEWIESKGFNIDNFIAHATPEFFAALQVGDAVIGILPVALAAKVCEAGATYYDLALPNLPAEWRGLELTPDQMNQAGATLSRYNIVKTGQKAPLKIFSKRGLTKV